MENKLIFIIESVINKDIEYINRILVISMLYGHGWNYAIPDKIEFDKFLNLFNKKLY
ncbi:hypothetical protein [Clostridium sp. D53t1_180928_C8]|uniref:hypothetical protein n=1 Tax=Clostridium sp. D53t1_180928_C8 TaxID=2787101 RepID=UPI0018A8EDE4|nr:hypothetical protein [Clostridium sp. D53t1_180928_C8]